MKSDNVYRITFFGFGRFPILSSPSPKKVLRELMLSSQADLSEIKYMYYFNCHQSIGGDMLILFHLYWLADKTLSMVLSDFSCPLSCYQLYCGKLISSWMMTYNHEAIPEGGSIPAVKSVPFLTQDDWNIPGLSL